MSGLPFFFYNAVGSKIQDVEAAIANEPEVCSGGDCDAGIEERGVFDGEAIEARCAVLEHCAPAYGSMAKEIRASSKRSRDVWE